MGAFPYHAPRWDLDLQATSSRPKILYIQRLCRITESQYILVHQPTPSFAMGRRRKNRTHLKGGVASNPGSAEGVPKSFVIKHGQVGHSLTQLVRDVRKVMEPNTASRLRVSPPRHVCASASG